ncbi:MAG TPA: serine/threonine-protein kinase [Kofleriaceae bacterium]|nr:serine/threonine-protein kinase [Kofleriaceae bacterium]
MFRTAYVYGHLLTVAFSLLTAVAYLVAARRLGTARRDLWNAGIYFCATAAGVIEMVQAGWPTLPGARVHLAVYTLLFVVVDLGFHLQYAGDALSPARRRLYWRAAVAHSGFCLILIALLLTGQLEDGVHHLELWGATSTMLAVSIPVALLLFLVPLGNVLLCSEMLLRRGPRQEERRLIALPMLFVPLLAAHEVGIVAGVGPGQLPVGGYVAAFVGVVGVFGLVLRLEEAAGQAGRSESFAGYLLERRIGSGGMAEVFRARRTGAAHDLGVEQEVAVKRLHADAASDDRLVQMFVEEARLIARLRHPNIVSLHDVGLEKGQLYLAMELVDGAPLYRLLRLLQSRGERLSVAAVAEIGIQMADALNYAHALTDPSGRSLEIVHRDVSPQNILVDRTGVVKLADFGIARTSERLSQTATGVLKGKIPYVAPEQIRAEPYDHRADLYALGVVLFELACNRLPFSAPSEAALIFAIVEGRPSLHLLDQRPPALSDTVRRCLAADPDDRPGSAAEIRQWLLPLRDEVRARRELQRLAEVAAEVDPVPVVPTSADTVVDSIRSHRPSGTSGTAG